MHFAEMKTIILLLCLSVLCLCEDLRSDTAGLQDVTAITLYAKKMTKGSGVDPAVPEIQCVGWCPISEPKTATCVNRESDGSNVQWECKADLEDGFEFDNVDVLCEGYHLHNLQESCRLKYTLRASSKTKKTPYTHDDTQEKSSLIKYLIRELNKTYISPAINYTRTDKSSSNNDYSVDGTSERRMDRSVVGLGGLDAAGGCAGCTNSINCPNSTGLTNCRNCFNCTGSTNCRNCRNCTGSTDCVHCNNIHGSRNCTNCTNCTGCTNCHNCNNLHGSTNCFNCNNCDGCNGCTV